MFADGRTSVFLGHLDLDLFKQENQPACLEATGLAKETQPVPTEAFRDSESTPSSMRPKTRQEYEVEIKLSLPQETRACLQPLAHSRQKAELLLKPIA